MCKRTSKSKKKAKCLVCLKSMSCQLIFVFVGVIAGCKMVYHICPSLFQTGIRVTENFVSPLKVLADNFFKVFSMLGSYLERVLHIPQNFRLTEPHLGVSVLDIWCEIFDWIFPYMNMDLLSAVPFLEIGIALFASCILLITFSNATPFPNWNPYNFRQLCKSHLFLWAAAACLSMLFICTGAGLYRIAFLIIIGLSMFNIYVICFPYDRSEERVCSTIIKRIGKNIKKKSQIERRKTKKKKNNTTNSNDFIFMTALFDEVAGIADHSIAVILEDIQAIHYQKQAQKVNYLLQRLIEEQPIAESMTKTTIAFIVGYAMLGHADQFNTNQDKIAEYLSCLLYHIEQPEESTKQLLPVPLQNSMYLGLVLRTIAYQQPEKLNENDIIARVNNSIGNRNLSTDDVQNLQAIQPFLRKSQSRKVDLPRIIQNVKPSIVEIGSLHKNSVDKVKSYSEEEGTSTDNDTPFSATVAVGSKEHPEDAVEFALEGKCISTDNDTPFSTTVAISGKEHPAGAIEHIPAVQSIPIDNNIPVSTAVAVLGAAPSANKDAPTTEKEVASTGSASLMMDEVENPTEEHSESNNSSPQKGSYASVANDTPIATKVVVPTNKCSSIAVENQSGSDAVYANQDTPVSGEATMSAAKNSLGEEGNGLEGNTAPANSLISVSNDTDITTESFPM